MAGNVVLALLTATAAADLQAQTVAAFDRLRPCDRVSPVGSRPD